MNRLSEKDCRFFVDRFCIRSALFWDIAERIQLNFLTTFRDNLSVPYSRINKSKNNNFFLNAILYDIRQKRNEPPQTWYLYLLCWARLQTDLTRKDPAGVRTCQREEKGFMLTCTWLCHRIAQFRFKYQPNFSLQCTVYCLRRGSKIRERPISHFSTGYLAVDHMLTLTQPCMPFVTSRKTSRIYDGRLAELIAIQYDQFRPIITYRSNKYIFIQEKDSSLMIQMFSRGYSTR